MDERALQMRVRVVLAGLVVPVVTRRREPIEPLDEVLLQPGLLVVHPDAGGDVHRGDEAHALRDLRARDDLRDALGDVHELPARARVEPEVLGVRAHQPTIASASISMSARSSIRRLTSTSVQAGRMSRKNSPCTVVASRASSMSRMNIRVRTT